MNTTWTIQSFDGINNMQEPSALKQPASTKQGNFGSCELVKCINFDIDDNGGLVKREVSPAIFSKTYDAKLTQSLGGRTFTATGDTLRYTKPFSSEYEDRRTSIKYSSAITLIQEIETGMWVSTTTNLYFHKGRNPIEVSGFTQVAEYNYPAIMGTGEKIAASKMLLKQEGFVAIFATTFGICVGDANGNLTNISEGTFSYIAGQRGISYIQEKNGMIQYQVRMINDIGDSYNEQTSQVTLDVDAY